MPDPTDADDPWGDLYRDLEVDAAAAKPADPIDEGEEPEPEPEETTFADAEEGEYEPQEAGVNGEPAGEDEQPGEEGPKKRRRRRRRRRKKKGPGEGEPAAPAAVDGDGAEAVGFDEDEPAADEERAVESVEDDTPETARQVIANWNVPSWPEIVAGLYRPDRG
jgi:hypothetical protein